MAIRLSSIINVNSDSITSGSGLIWDVVSTNTAGNDGNGYIFNTSSGPLVLTLPTNPSEGDQIGIKDISNNFATNNLTILGAGNKIAGSTNNFIIDLNGYGGSLIYTDSTNGWVLFADYDNTYLPINGGDLIGGISAPSYTENGVLLSNKYESKDAGIQGHISSTTNPHSVTKSQVGLANVDNTSDVNKPVSTATQTALNQKTDTSVYLTHTGSTANPHSVTKSQVNLANVDNTSDASKPVSTATQTALNLKLNTSVYTSEKNAANGFAGLDASGKIDANQLPSIAITNTFVVASQAAMLALTVETGDVAVRTDLNKSFILQGINPTILGDWQELLTPTDSVASVAGKTGVVTLVKADVGLANVDNTSDVNKPVSTATQTALNLKFNSSSWVSATAARDGYMTSVYAAKLDGIATGAQVNTVTSVASKTGAVSLVKADVGLANVDNTSDASKPVSTATQTALNLKANLASPALTGTPTAPTATAGTNTTQLSTTAFVAALGALKADLASPALTGTPTAPTATASTNSTQLATTAFVRGEITRNQILTTAATLVNNGPIYLVDTTAAAFNLTLPATAAAGDKIVIYDIAAKFETNSPIVVTNGHNIMGLAENMTLNMNGVRIELIYYNTTLGWRVFA